MAQFSYVAVSKQGEKKTGVITAKDEAEVRVLLRTQALRPTKIAKTTALEMDVGQLLGLGSGVSPKEILIFTKQMSVLISSGIPLVQGLEIITDQMESPGMKRVLLSVRDRITGGGFFWESLAAHKKSFSDIYVNLIRAGEASGSLDTILNRLTKYLDDNEKLKAMVKSAMMYPLIVTVIAIGVLIIMLVFVIPKFESLIKASGQSLPLPTQIVINSSHWLRGNYPILLGIVLGGGYLIRSYLKTDEGKKFLDYQLLKMPVIGMTLNKIAVARFSRTMQTLLSSGVNLIEALDISKKAVGNWAIEDSISKIKSEIEQGNRLSSVMAKLPVFPSMATQMVAVGENTGNLDKMLERVADWYEEEAKNAINNLAKMMEPVALVVLGGMVGGMLISMYLPIFKMAGG